MTLLTTMHTYFYFLTAVHSKLCDVRPGKCVSEREHIIMQSCFNHIKLLAVLFSDIANI